MNAPYLFEEVVVEPNKKYDRAQNLDGKEFGVEKKAMKVERLFTTAGPETKRGLRQASPLFSRRIEEAYCVTARLHSSLPCRVGLFMSKLQTAPFKKRIA